MFILVYRLAMDARTLEGCWCGWLKISELAQGFSDGHTINGSQETFCSKHKGFLWFLSCSQIGVQEVQGFKGSNSSYPSYPW